MTRNYTTQRDVTSRVTLMHAPGTPRSSAIMCTRPNDVREVTSTGKPPTWPSSPKFRSVFGGRKRTPGSNVVHRLSSRKAVSPTNSEGPSEAWTFGSLCDQGVQIDPEEGHERPEHNRRQAFQNITGNGPCHEIAMGGSDHYPDNQIHDPNQTYSTPAHFAPANSESRRSSATAGCDSANTSAGVIRGGRGPFDVPTDGRSLPLASELLTSSRTAAGTLSTVGDPVLAVEFKQEQIEVQTSPCSRFDGLLEEIRRGRDAADAAARAVRVPGRRPGHVPSGDGRTHHA